MLVAKRKSRKDQPSEEAGISLKALTSTQGKLLAAIKHFPMVVVTGPAGTGKTYISAGSAAKAYKEGFVDKIILTRPTVAVDTSIGFFPGTLEEKMSPWTQPFISVLEDFLGKGAVETMLRKGNIEIVPFEVIRGRSWNNCFVILDEAQNTSEAEIKAFVTRIGENCTTIINGDLLQTDIGRANGLALLQRLYRSGSVRLKELCGFVHFGLEDIVRSEICRLWVEAFTTDKNT